MGIKQLASDVNHSLTSV